MQLEDAILRTWLRHMPYEIVRQEQLERLYEHVTPSLADFRAGILRLINKGIVLTEAGPWQERSLMLCSMIDIYRKCFPIEQTNVHPSPQFMWQERTEIPLFDCFFRLIVFLRQFRLERTKRGTWNKKQWDELVRFIGLEVKGVGVLNKLVEMAIEIAVGMNYIYEVHDRMQVEWDNVEKWLRLPRGEAESGVYERWKQTMLKQTIACEQHVVLWLECLQKSPLISLKKFYSWLAHNDLGKERKMERFVHDWMQTLTQYGWLQQAEEPVDDIYVKWTLTWNEAALKAVYVQADFELIVPYQVRLLALWHIESFAERKQVEVGSFSRYTLTKASIRKAIISGYTSEQIIGHLRELSKFEVPQNVVSTIRQWSESIVASSNFSVSKTPVFVTPEASSLERAKMGDNKHSAAGQHLEPFEPDVLYPYIERIPLTWLNEVRSYHESTYEKIIRLALQYKARVHCRFVEEQPEANMLTPLQFHVDEKDEWSFIAVNGHKKQVQIRRREIDGIQLVLPGLNDEPRLWE